MFFEHVHPKNTSNAIIDSNLNSFTYADLYYKINEIELIYQTHKLVKSNLVIFKFDKSFTALAHLLCCIKLGIIYIPIDVNTPQNRLENIINSSKANAIINDDFSIKILNNKKSPINKNACSVLYTSGSTGKPKGVVISHNNLQAFINWSSQEFNISNADTLTSYAPFHFDLSTFDVFAALKNGASIWLINKALSSNFRLISEQIFKVKPTVWYATPTVYKLLYQYGNLSEKYSPRLALFAGEVFNLKELNLLRKTWHKTTFYNLYGPTETNVCTFYKLPNNIEEEKTEPYSIGKPCPYAQTRIKEDGELLISGKSLMLEYLNEPTLTEQKFVEHDGIKWLKTGDIVTQQNNLIYYKYRNDRMVKHNGYRVELGEIENELKKHSDINDIACIYCKGKIIAVYTGVKKSSINLKTFCNKQLLKYMIPNHFFYLKQMPINSNGKIDYSELINNFNLNE